MFIAPEKFKSNFSALLEVPSMQQNVLNWLKSGILRDRSDSLM